MSPVWKSQPNNKEIIMALTRITGSSNWAFGVNSSVSVSGIVEVISYSVKRDKTTIVEGKGQDGEFKAVLIGGEKLSIQAEGYASAESLPQAGGAISIFAVVGIVTSVEIVGSNEDFVKVRVQGIGYPAITGAITGG